MRPACRYISKTLDMGTEVVRPDKASRNSRKESRNPVPIAKSRYVLNRRFLGQREREDRLGVAITVGFDPAEACQKTGAKIGFRKPALRAASVSRQTKNQGDKQEGEQGVEEAAVPEEAVEV